MQCLDIDPESRAYCNGLHCVCLIWLDQDRDGESGDFVDGGGRGSVTSSKVCCG